MLMIALMVLAVVGVTLFALALGAAVLRGIVWLVMLPLRLLFALLFLPFLLIKAIVAGLMFLVAGPLVALLAVVAAVVVTMLVAIPLAPVLLLLGAIWLVTRPRRQVLAAGTDMTALRTGGS